MSKKSSKSSNNEKSRIVFLLFIVVLFVVILISTVFSDWTQIMDNRRQTEELTSYKQLLLEEEASLKSEVTKLHDPEYIARYAREKYMYTKDGETILRIIDGKVVETE
ncbi:MAG: septum formation initiator family protein [Bacilli bacterium]|nr:septum formation initiator family protein [Bacilli bacterium]